MTTPIRNILCASNLEFITNPPIYTALKDVSYTLSASGRSIRGAGNRLWTSTTDYSASLTGTLLAGQTLTLPLTSAFLPTTHFDAIILVNVNGSQRPIGVSNSPDNYSVINTTSPIVEKFVYWTDLYYADWNPSSYRQYTAFNEVWPGIGALPLKVYFAEPTPVTAQFTANVEYISAKSPALTSPTQTATVTVPANSTSFTLLNVPSYFNFYPTAAAAHLKISISCSDINFKSLLPYYHWSLTGNL